MNYPTHLRQQPLINRNILLVSFLNLSPPRKAKHFVPDIQTLYIRSNFHNRPRRAITQYLWMLDEETAIILMQVQRRGSSPLAAHTDLSAYGLDGRDLDQTKFGFDAYGSYCVVR